MNAAEAKSITTHNDATPAIKALRDHVDRQIENAAKHGYSEVIDPLNGLRLFFTNEMAEALYDSLRADGFTVTIRINHISAPTTTVSW